MAASAAASANAGTPTELTVVTSPQRKKKRKRKGKKERNGEKRARPGRTSARNQARAMDDDSGGLKVFPTPQGPEAARGLRCCILDAIVPLLPEETRKATRERILPLLSTEEDTAMSRVAPVLESFGVKVQCVSRRYLGKKEAPLLILKERNCKLILRLRLRIPGYEWNHFVAWDGRVIHDSPASAIVNYTTDRASVKSARRVFGKTFYEWGWKITSVFELQFR